MHPGGAGGLRDGGDGEVVVAERVVRTRGVAGVREHLSHDRPAADTFKLSGYCADVDIFGGYGFDSVSGTCTFTGSIYSGVNEFAPDPSSQLKVIVSGVPPSAGVFQFASAGVFQFA